MSNGQFRVRSLARREGREVERERERERGGIDIAIFEKQFCRDDL